MLAWILWIGVGVGMDLQGPYASLDEVCKAKLAEAQLDRICQITPRTEHAAVVKVLDDLDDGRADGYLAVRDARGWFVDGELADFKTQPQLALLHDNLRYTFLIVGLDERPAGIVLRAVHAIFFNADTPFYCVGLKVFCRLDGDGAPVCSKPLIAAGKADCHPNQGRYWPAVAKAPRALADWASWDWNRPITLLDDGRIEVPRMPRLTLPRKLRKPLLSYLPATLSAPSAGRYTIDQLR